LAAEGKRVGRVNLWSALDGAMRFIERVDDVTSIAELNAAFAVTVAPFGVRDFAAAIIGRNGRPTEPVVFASTRDPEWVARYVGRRYDRVDPVVPKLYRTTRPFTWDEIEQPHAPMAVQELFSEVRAMGVEGGYVVPYHNGAGEIGCVTMQGGDMDLSPRERATLRLAAIFYAEVARELAEVQVDRATKTPLTARQLECLQWAAEGKSDWEISSILNIAEGTVHRHFENLRATLKVATRAQAIVIAVRQGWIPVKCVDPHIARTTTPH
jgi:LuxR family quorum sensing-dependent transcriptional regulator